MGQYFFLFILGLGIYLRINRGKTIDKFCNDYHNAIHSGNRIEALNLGRRYYSKTRSGFFGLSSGRLTIYDEQAITNDLSVMK